jgi:type III secretion protein L
MGLALLVDRPGFRLTADHRIIKRDEAALVSGAKDVLDRAHEQAQRIISSAELAYRRKQREGYREGKKQAQQELACELAAAVAAKAVTLKSLEDLLADLVLDSLEAVFHDIDRQAFFVKAIHTVQGRLRAARFAQLRVAPHQVGQAQAAVQHTAQQSGLGPLITVVADEALEADRCVFQSDLGTADASLRRQLHAIRKSIANALHSLEEQHLPASQHDGVLSDPVGERR